MFNFPQDAAALAAALAAAPAAAPASAAANGGPQRKPWRDDGLRGVTRLRSKEVGRRVGRREAALLRQDVQEARSERR